MKKLINRDIHEYFGEDKNQTCTGCSQCLNQQHRFIHYKYPKSINSRYGEHFSEKHKDKEAKEHFKNYNYDLIRH